MTALFAWILVQSPFLWSSNTLGYVFARQIATAVAVPFFCGYLSDWIVKVLSKRSGGFTHPEHQQNVLIIPLVAILVSTSQRSSSAR
jgi:hypothetical protein